MNKEKNVLDYYVLCNKLKNVVRTGWQIWDVKRDRVESIAEHIYGVQMLAIAMKSEYEYDIDIMKVIYMLAIHELGETIIGDLILFDNKFKDKKTLEHKAVHKILSPLIDGDKIEKLFLEFDARETPEAKFAYQCDKLEADIQSKLYDQEHCVDLTNQQNNRIFKPEEIEKVVKEGKSWSNWWIEFSQSKYPYDKNFLAIEEYMKNNKIGENNE